MRQSTDTASNDTSRILKSATLKGRQGRIRSKSRLTCGGQVTANEQDSGVDVVRGCFSEGSDSILSLFSWEPLRAKLQDN